MPSRRFFVRGISTLTLARFLTACGAGSEGFKVLLLQGSIPARLLSGFRQAQGREQNLVFKSEVNFKALFKLLETWRDGGKDKEDNSSFNLPLADKPTPKIANVITLGDGWLSGAVASDTLASFSPGDWSNWDKLPEKWQELVKRNREGDRDDNGQVWGAPYRWGTTMIAYRKDKLKELGVEIGDWSDLWRPELKGRLSVVDNPREVIGLTLKKMGYSYNERELSRIPGLLEQLRNFNAQVKFYSSTHYLEPLILGDTTAAVGWSGDILPLLQSRGNTIGAIVPRSGSALWADLWVKPKTAPDSPLTARWIDYCWGEPAIKQIALFANGLSPVPIAPPESLRDNPLLNMSPATLDDSEFLYPLPPTAREEYDRLWREMRLGQL